MTKNKKNLGLKVLSTTAAIAMLASSVATPVSVFAAKMDQSTSEKTGSTRALIGGGNFTLKSYTMNQVPYNNIQGMLRYDNGALEKGTNRHVYPSNVTTSPAINPNVSYIQPVTVTVHFNDSKLSGSYSYQCNIFVYGQPSSGGNGNGNGNGSGNGNGNVTDGYSITMTTSSEKTIEYGTLFDPATSFSGYVEKDNAVYSSVKSYSGNYRNGVKAGTYSGNLNFKNTSYNFSLDAPVKVIVVTKKLDEATNLVNNLFTDKTNSVLKEQITQNDIDLVLDKVNALPKTSEKDALLTLMEKAQELLNHGSIEYKAEEAVNNLFADNEHTTLADDVTQADIDAAKEAVNKLTDEAKKEEMLNEIQKAQDLLTKQEETNKAEQNVNDLFADDEHTALADGVTQEDIDAAKEAANKVTDEAKKEEMLNEIEKAQDLLTAKEEQKAEENVNNLFADDEHTTLADGITQKDIDAAKEAVNKLTDEAKKEELLNEIQKAQDLLTAKEEAGKAAEDVNNLFADKEHTTLADGITQKDIDAVKDQVNKLTDGAKKEELLNEIQKAQDLLTAKEEQKVAEDVNNLFADKEHTTLADGITQKDIDAAKDQVNKLTDEAKKEELLNEIQKAQDLLNEMNKLTMNNLTAQSSEISGSARANSQLRISINGVAKTVIKADSEGKYEWRVSKLALNDVIKVEMRNPETNKYDQFVDQRITESGMTEEKITLNEMQEGDTKISGKTTPNAQVRINFDGKPKNIVTADAQGNYEFVFASGLKTGTEIKVELKSKGTYSISETATVIARVLTLNPITSADDVMISGKTRNPNQKLRISLNGKAKTIISSKEGVYEYRMGKVAADSAIKVEAMNGSTVIESVEQIVKGISNEERPDVKLDAIEAGTRTTITGKAPANVALRISINGKTKSVVSADAEGNFSYMLGKVQAGDKVKIEIRESKTFVFATEVTAH